MVILPQGQFSKYDLACALSDRFKRWNRLVDSHLSTVGLNASELRVLVMLSQLGPRSMATLAKEQGMTAPGMTIVVDNIERKDLARRVRSDADRRAINVAMTGRGGETVKRAVKLQDKFIEKALRGVTTQELNSFLAVLDRILAAAATARF
jgi:MarR family 2-MHQ and catechol resistance regulon transcriptional repressor